MRLIHTADWQIGKPFGRFGPEVRNALAEARFDAIDRIGRIAADCGVDHVIVAGDVFDNVGPSDAIWCKRSPVCPVRDVAGGCCQATTTTCGPAVCGTGFGGRPRTTCSFSIGLNRSR